MATKDPFLAPGMIGLLLKNMCEVCQDLKDKFPELDGPPAALSAADLAKKIALVRSQATGALALIADLNREMNGPHTS